MISGTSGVRFSTRVMRRARASGSPSSIRVTRSFIFNMPPGMLTAAHPPRRARLLLHERGIVRLLTLGSAVAAAALPRGLGAEPGLHHERVLARIEIVALPPADHAEPEALVQRERLDIGRPHLEEEQLHTALPSVLHRLPEQRPRHPAAPEARVHGE